MHRHEAGRTATTIHTIMLKRPWHPCRLVLASLGLFLTAHAYAATYYVDPAKGKMTNSGSSSSPWSTLEAVFAAKKTFAAGDTIILRNGYHGFPTVRGKNSGNVTIRPESGHKPKLRKLLFTDASRWVVKDLDISPLHAGSSSYDTGRTVEMAKSSSYITLQDCLIRSVFSVSGWTLSQWQTGRLGTAVFCRAPYSTITGNEIRNVGGGITVYTEAHHTVVSYNVIDTIRDDGFRGLASDCRFEYNTLRNMYAIDSNHDDAFQSWTVGADGKVGTGVLRNVVLRGNVFISYTDPNQPWKASMQGIALFDGLYENWVIENNVIITDMWHGIALYGGRNCRIVNNTVVKNPINAKAYTPWIQVSPDPSGTASSGTTVHNNLTTKLNFSGSGSVQNNLITTSYTSHFVDFAKFNVRLKSSSTAVNKGASTYAPKIDADLRTRSAPVDIGAFEYLP